MTNDDAIPGQVDTDSTPAPEMERLNLNGESNLNLDGQKRVAGGLTDSEQGEASFANYSIHEKIIEAVS